MSNRIRLRCNIFKGNAQKFEQLAKDEGLTQEEYINEICNNEIVYGDENAIRLLKHLGIKNPFNNENGFPSIITRNNKNTEELSIYINQKVLEKLERKASMENFQTRGKVGALIDKICSYPILILKQQEENNEE